MGLSKTDIGQAGVVADSLAALLESVAKLKSDVLSLSARLKALEPKVVAKKAPVKKPPVKKAPAKKAPVKAPVAKPKASTGKKKKK